MTGMDEKPEKLLAARLYRLDREQRYERQRLAVTMIAAGGLLVALVGVGHPWRGYHDRDLGDQQTLVVMLLLFVSTPTALLVRYLLTHPAYGVIAALVTAAPTLALRDLETQEGLGPALVALGLAIAAIAQLLPPHRTPDGR